MKPRQPTDARSARCQVRAGPPARYGSLRSPVRRSGPRSRPRPVRRRHRDLETDRDHTDPAAADPDHHPARRPAASPAWRCRNCGLAQPLAVAYVCPACFGPLEVTYDYGVVARDADPRRDRRHDRPASGAISSCCRSRRPRPGRCRSGRRRWSPPIDSARPSGSTACWIKDDTRNPSLSFKDRAVAVAAARAVEFGVPALACASTGNLAGATAAAAAAVGLPAYVFIPADLEPAKVDHALAYGATVVPIDGTYDDVNRLCLEIADETGWGFVNINLRPFYAEGSKTLAYEIAESLGWRSPGRGRRAGRVGRDVHARRARLRGARRARAHRAPADPLRRRSGGRLCAGRDRVRGAAPTSSSRSANPTRSSARWPSATRPTAATWSRSRGRPAGRSRRSPTR